MDRYSFIKQLMGSLRFRIMLPIFVFTIIFSLLFILLNNYYTSNLLDLRLKRESQRISRLLSESDFLLTDTYLERIGEVIEGKIALFNRQGHLIASSFNSNATASPVGPFTPMDMWKQMEGRSNKILVSKVMHKKQSYLMTWGKIPGKDMGHTKLLAVLTSLEDLEATKDKALVQTLFLGLFSLTLAFTLAGFISKSVTDEVNTLSQVTTRIASGKFTSKAGSSNINELKSLTSSINAMGEQLTAYQANLVQSTQFASSGRISSAMAHEIKNPLSSIKMMIQILDRRFKTDKESHLMTTSLLEEIDRLERLVTDLNSFSKPTRIKLQPHFPQEVLTQTFQVMEPKLKHLNINPTLIIDYGGPRVQMDKNRIKQVLWNIIMNAAESMPHGGEIRISLAEVLDKTMIQFSVKDQGAGMAPEISQKMFLPFFSTKREGVGLGLYISKEIATAHLGSLEINTNESGTEAVLTLPKQGVNI